MTHQNGSLTLIVGPMFSGKSDELLRRLSRLKYAKRNHLLFKPERDTRTSALARSRTGTQLQALTFATFADLLELVHAQDGHDDVRPVIGIDEVQFAPRNGVETVITTLMRRGHDVHIAGLDLTFKGEPFETTAALLAMAHKVIKLNAYCSVCGQDAHYSQLLVLDGVDDNHIKVGDSEYSARCLAHFTPPGT